MLVLHVFVFCGRKNLVGKILGLNDEHVGVGVPFSVFGMKASWLRGAFSDLR